MTLLMNPKGNFIRHQLYHVLKYRILTLQPVYMLSSQYISSVLQEVRTEIVTETKKPKTSNT